MRRRNPFEEVEQLLNQLGGTSPFASSRLSGPKSGASNVEYKEDKVVVTVDVPGYSKEDLKVTLDYPVLSISGEMSSEDTHENTATHQSQSFSEKIHLRKEVEREATTAEYKNGILTITLPYTEETSGTEISIE